MCYTVLDIPYCSKCFVSLYICQQKVEWIYISKRSDGKYGKLLLTYLIGNKCRRKHCSKNKQVSKWGSNHCQKKREQKKKNCHSGCPCFSIWVKINQFKYKRNQCSSFNWTAELLLLKYLPGTSVGASLSIWYWR